MYGAHVKLKFLCFVLVFHNLAYGSGEKFTTLNHLSSQPTQVWMNVFVHGAVKGQFARWNLLKVWFDKIENTEYEKVINILREDSFFWQYHAMQKQGLHRISMNNTHGSSAAIIAHMYHTVGQTHQEQPSINYYYTYGWSGLLSFKMRYEDSRRMYENLAHEIQKVKEEVGVMPRLRIICFSHGGNVALNLALVRQLEPQNASLLVDELIFLGVPIQRETDYLISDNMFKKAYHFYSTEDKIQTADCFSFKRLFSNRKFQSRPSFKIPEKLTQVSVKITGHSFRKKYAEEKELLMPSSPSYKIKTTNTAPGHIELWYLGYTPAWYRKDFPLYPLPIVVTIPSMLHAIKEHEDSVKNHVEVILQPQREIMRIKNKRKRSFMEVPFVTADTLEKLKNHAEYARPTPRYYLEHRLKIKAALLAARGEMLDKIDQEAMNIGEHD